MTSKVMISTILILFLSISCTTDNALLLEGNWQISQAYRDDVPTTTLDDLYIHFEKNGQARSNLFGRDEDITYTLDGKNLTLHFSAARADMQIIALTKEELLIEGSIQERSFKFQFLRAEQDTTQ